MIEMIIKYILLGYGALALASTVIFLVGILVLETSEKRRIMIIQQEWDDFSVGMDQEEKLDCIHAWSKEQCEAHGWIDVYIPRL